MEKYFIIRKAKIKDLKDILRLNFDLFKKEYEEYDRSLDLSWTYGMGGKYFMDKIAKKNSFVEVIEYKEKVIAYLCGGISERLYYRKKAIYAELENMIIENNFRGRGLGKILVKNFIIWCRKNKVDYISVTAFAKNKQALGLYKKLGFKEYNLTLEMKIRK